MTPGQVLAARYELRDAIARGGMGEVWVGYDRVLGREVALKVLDIGAARDDRAAERFRHEATAAAALSHPHVVAVYDAGVEGGLAFLVMELLSGPTVAELIQQRGSLPVELALDLARQAAEGLGAVHQVGVVHRDVKPGNLMLDQHGRLKVVDFGIARLAEATTPQVTASGSVVGSAAFLSPEQARGEAATAASDHYALGCVLMAMLTGQPPFAAEHPLGLLRKHLDASPPRVRDRRPDVPAWLDELVDGLLAKDPRRRAGGVAALLRSGTAAPGASGQGMTAIPAAVPAPTPPPPAPPGSTTAVLPTVGASPPVSHVRRGPTPRALLAMTGAGLIALLAVAGGVWLLARDDDPTNQNQTGLVLDDGPVGSPSTPADSAPADPSPTEPSPADSAPADPDPADPAAPPADPADPDPADPAAPPADPADPDPADPAAPPADPADPDPADPAAPPADLTAALTAAVDSLEDAVRQTFVDGGLDEKAAEDLERQVDDLRKRIEQGKLDDLDKELDELLKKIDEFERDGKLDAAGAARIRGAIEGVRTAA